MVCDSTLKISVDIELISFWEEVEIRNRNASYFGKKASLFGSLEVKENCRAAGTWELDPVNHIFLEHIVSMHK